MVSGIRPLECSGNSEIRASISLRAQVRYTRETCVCACECAWPGRGGNSKQREQSEQRQRSIRDQEVLNEEKSQAWLKQKEEQKKAGKEEWEPMAESPG